MRPLLHWLARTLNPRHGARTLAAFVRRHGLGILLCWIAWELAERTVLAGACVLAGVPELIPVTIGVHLEFLATLLYAAGAWILALCRRG